MSRHLTQRLVKRGFRTGIPRFYRRSIRALAVLTGNTCRALRSLRSGLALGALHTLDTLGALLTLFALWSSLTLHTLCALRALRAGRALQLADGYPVERDFRPDVALMIRAHLIHILVAVRDCLAKCRQCRVNVLHEQTLAVLAVCAGLALRALRTLCAGVAFRALRTCRADVALFTFWALCTGHALNALRASCALCALCALHTLRALRTANGNALRRNCRSLHGKRHNAVLVHARHDYRAEIAGFTFRALFANITFFTLWTDNAMHHRNAVHILDRALCKLHPAPLRQRPPARIEHNMTARAGRLEIHAVG